MSDLDDAIEHYLGVMGSHHRAVDRFKANRAEYEKALAEVDEYGDLPPRIVDRPPCEDLEVKDDEAGVDGS